MPNVVNHKLCKPKAVELFEHYTANGVAFLQSTKPYHSVQSLSARVVSVDTTNGVAVAVFDKGQILDFFSYGQNDNIILSQQAINATEAETSINTRFRTNNDDFAIEWISASCRGQKLTYGNPAVFGDTDPKVLAAMNAAAQLVDPFSQRQPAEQGSPATLERVFFHAVAPHITVQFEWDNADRTEKMGTLDQYTQGGGESYLHSNGEPSSQARIEVPEGYLWAKEGESGSNFHAPCTLRNDVVIPISLPTIVTTGAFVAPGTLSIEFMLRLGGIHFRVPGTN